MALLRLTGSFMGKALPEIYLEVVRNTPLVVATRYIFETWITVALMYMVLTLSLSLFTGRLERRLRRVD